MTRTIEEVGIRLRADGAVETSNGVELTSQALDRLQRRAEQAAQPLNQLGTSARQTAQAMRMLPMQITDAATSLASGMPVWMVAIQQGGQIKDSFGGAAPAVRALSSALGPVGFAMTAVAGAAATMLAAMSQSSTQQHELVQALALTGNAAGVTEGQIGSMADAIANRVGNRSQAMEALTQLASSGQVAGHSMERLGELAVRMGRVTSTSAEEMVRRFAELGREPVQASVKLNETTNHLTVAVYEQIRALQEQGRTADAAALAQKAYADALEPRVQQIEERLGGLRKAWQWVSEAASGAWAAMLNGTRAQTLDEELKEAERTLAALGDAPRRGGSVLQADQRRQAAQQRVNDLRQQIYELGEVAAAESSAAEATRRRIAEREKEKEPKAAKASTSRDLDSWSAYRTWGEAGRAEVGWEDAQAALAAKEREQALQKTAAAAERDLAALQRQRDALADQTAELGMNDQALLRRRQALIDQQIAEAAALLSVVDGAQGYERQSAALREQIDTLRQLRDLEAENADKRQQVKTDTAAARRKEQDAADNRRRAEDIASSIEDGLMNGFRSGRSLADIFANELKAQFARLVLRPMIQPIADGLAGGSGGWLSLFSGFTSFLGASTGGGAGFGTGSAYGNLDLGGFFHAGGIAGAEPTFTRALPASTWAGAPRLHTGGLAGDEVPAVLRKGEGVFTQGQMRHLAPVDQVAAAAKPSITYAPVFHVDSRSDRAQLLADMQRMTRASQAELVEMMNRGMV